MDAAGATLPPIQALQTRSGRLSFMCSGAGPQTLVLFNGAGVTLEGWRPLYPRIERLGRVLAWNRFGVQGSDPPPQRLSGRVVVASLRELLGYSGLEPPFVLLAHSLGGLYANLFARLLPQETAGVLLLEATHPDDQALLCREQAHMVHSLEKVSALPPGLFEANVEAELAAMEETVREIAAAGDFPPVPLRVVTGGLTPRGAMLSPAAVAARRANQQALARLSPRGVQVIADRSGHFPQLTDPELVLSVLEELLAEVEAETMERRGS